MGSYDKHRNILDEHEDRVLHLLTRSPILSLIAETLYPGLEEMDYSFQEEYMYLIQSRDYPKAGGRPVYKDVDTVDYWYRATYTHEWRQQTATYCIVIDLNVASARKLIDRLRKIREALNSNDQHTTKIIVVMRAPQYVYDLVLESRHWIITPYEISEDPNSQVPINMVPAKWVLKSGKIGVLLEDQGDSGEDEDEDEDEDE